jgi:hypothetical protein
MILSYKFRHTVVISDDMRECVETLFLNGWRHRDTVTPEDGDKARKCGYIVGEAASEAKWFRNAVFRYVFDRHIFHTVLCECYGMPHSLAFWELARKLPIDYPKYAQIKFEDDAVFELQAYFTGRGKLTPTITELAELLHIEPKKLRAEFTERIEKARNGAAKCQSL